MAINLSNIIAIVNSGFSDSVMEIAKEKGARGGTIIPANSSLSDEAMKLYGLGIHSEKEIVMILVNDSLANDILNSLYDKLGPGSEALGIFFTLPVKYASENLIKQYN